MLPTFGPLDDGELSPQVMMCEYEGQTDPWFETQEMLNYVCLVFFTVEMFCKLVAYFPRKVRKISSWSRSWANCSLF